MKGTTNPQGKATPTPGTGAVAAVGWPLSTHIDPSAPQNATQLYSYVQFVQCTEHSFAAQWLADDSNWPPFHNDCPPLLKIPLVQWPLVIRAPVRAMLEQRKVCKQSTRMALHLAARASPPRSRQGVFDAQFVQEGRKEESRLGAVFRDPFHPVL